MLTPTENKDFFISYTSIDVNWATWIAQTLEANGYTTVIQEWDFEKGGSFINDMHKSIETCSKIIIVMSEKYFKSDYCTTEWQNMLAKDLTGKERRIIPIRIENINPEGLLKSRTFVDLFDIVESQAKERLLSSVFEGNKKRIAINGFPGEKIEFPRKMPFNNLPNRNIFFTGRDYELNVIASEFQKEEYVTLTQTIVGLGGIGKTQIALEYAYRYSNRYRYIWLFNAETNQSIIDSIIKFFECICNNKTTSDKTEHTIAWIRNWASENKGWLFIFDNAEDFNTLKTFLPSNNSRQGNILITSRNIFWDKTGNKALHVNSFEKHEALNFLHNRTQIWDDVENSSTLCDLLGGLPLALEYAAAYITESSRSFSEYIDLYRQYKFKLLNKRLADSESGVNLTWRLSIDKISNKSTRQFLYLCAYYASENISIDLFFINNQYLPSPLKGDITDHLMFDEIIHELRRYSLIKFADNNISIHRLLQEAIRYSVENDIQYLSCCFYHINDLMKNCNYFTREGRDTSRKLLLHALSIYECADNTDLKSDLHVLCFNIAVCYCEHAAYNEAKQFHQKALSIREKIFCEEHPDTATSYINIAYVYEKQGDNPNALELYKKALVIRERVLGLEHPDTATSYDNIACVYVKQGDYQRALKLYLKALAIRKKVFDKDNTDIASSYNNIAFVYAEQGDSQKALEWYQKALIICKMLGQENLEMASCYNNIAFEYAKQWNSSRALECFQKALVIREKVLGMEHPDTASCYNNIATEYVKKGNSLKALEWFQKALSIREKVFGREHPYTAYCYYNIAFVYGSQGDYAKALELNQKALLVFEKMLNKGHTTIGLCYNNMAFVYSKQGLYPKALELNQKALLIFEEVLGKEHPTTAFTYKNIAFVYDKQGDSAKAMEWYQKALSIREKVLGKDHPDTASSYNNIAGIYSSQGNADEALKWHQKALSIRENVLGKDHPDTASSYNDMAYVYASQGDSAKAMEWYQKALSIRENVLGKEHPDTATSYNSIASLYTSQGAYSKASELYQKVLQIREKVLGREHPDTACSYSDIAFMYVSQVDYPKALEWYQKALPIFETKLGLDHSYTKTVLYNLKCIKTVEASVVFIKRNT